MDIIELDKGCYVGKKVAEHNFQNIVTSETIYPATYISDWHYHQNPHYSHILNGGSKEIRVRGSLMQSQGDGLYYHPGIAHQNIHYQANTRIFNLEIEQAFFKDHDLEIPSEAQMFSDRIWFNTTGLVSLLKEHYFHDQQSGLVVEQLCVELIADSVENIKFQPEWTRKIIPVLYDNWNNQLTLSDLASFIEIHPVTLSKYFSKYFRCTLGDYIRKIKIGKSMEMIRAGKYSLTEITYICGFSDQSHFTKTFFRMTGLLPKQYRKL